MLPFNVALIAIATLFYAWRDVYVPRRRVKTVTRDRIARLLWAAAAHNNSDSRPVPMTEEPEEWEHHESAAPFALFRDIDCRVCGGTHTFHVAGETDRPAGSTYEFTCPTSGKSAWIWWLGTPEPAEIVPADSITLTWVAN